MKRNIKSLLLIFAVVFVANAQVSRFTPAAPSADKLRTHVTYLASDKLEGRRTGTAGARLAADYVASEFARYGLRPPTGDQPHSKSSTRRFMQEFPYIAGVDLGKNNSVILTATASQAGATAQSSGIASLDLRLAEDWMPIGFSSNASALKGELVFVGYGIKVDEINYNDYAGAPVGGRIALAFSGTPDGDNPHGHFARYTDVRWKAIAARNNGAAALIVIAREENFKEDRLAQLRYNNNAGDAGLPVLVISRQAATRILAGLGPVNALEKAAQITAAPTAAIAPELRRPSAQQIPNVSMTISTDVARRNVPAHNVVGILDGADAGLRNEVIVIGAHYDHLGLGGEGSLAPREGAIHHGADDNASGVAGLLELARIFAEERKTLKRTIVFVAFSGEEEGLLGSNYFVNNPILPQTKTVAMINMDMIGRMKDNKLMIGGVGTATEWREMIASANVVRGMDVTNNGPKVRTRDGDNTPEVPRTVPIVISANGEAIVGIDRKTGKIEMLTRPPTRFELSLNEDGFGPSDHSSFYAKQIPVLFFFTGTHEDYHKPSDTAEKINYEDEARLIAFVAEISRSLNQNAKAPTYAVAKGQPVGRSVGFRVYLGTIPSYAESTDGMTLDGVRDDSPAAKAGLKAGDKITRMAGREVRNVQDYTYALSEMKAGQEYEVEIVRGGEKLTLKITPTARK